MSGQIGVLRRCQRCATWQSIDAYVHSLDRLCRRCMREKAMRVQRIGLNRGMAITPLGRAYLRELHEVERQDAIA